ncbi:hypothetical protein DSO57_1023951 [Entomophthora muscae]|uniref:Uncharacterized protein n=1 Tax=Entomophthora muscae TaxID=34485 RepID=A0ACC2UN49_9FUNG|nr:hypothetical protein DSO57_1023951 [Entomophthora muscae]
MKMLPDFDITELENAAQFKKYFLGFPPDHKSYLALVLTPSQWVDFGKVITERNPNHITIRGRFKEVRGLVNQKGYDRPKMPVYVVNNGENDIKRKNIIDSLSKFKLRNKYTWITGYTIEKKFNIDTFSASYNL